MVGKLLAHNLRVITKENTLLEQVEFTLILQFPKFANIDLACSRLKKLPIIFKQANQFVRVTVREETYWQGASTIGVRVRVEPRWQGASCMKMENLSTTNVKRYCLPKI